VVGKLFAASYSTSTPATLTIGDMGTAFTNATDRVNPNFTNLASGKPPAIGSLIIVPGLCKWTTGVSIGSDVTIIGGSLSLPRFN
ncbi:hypothetical protein B0H12DRAFT_1036727, partial [Mycena haematopus]